MLEEALVIAIDDENAIEVVDLMLDGDGEESTRGKCLMFPVFVLIVDGHGLESFDGEELSREREASFFEEDSVFLVSAEGGVDEDEFLLVYLDHRQSE